MPVHSFRSLPADLATLTRNTVRFGRDHTTELLATPTEIQRRAFDLLALEPTVVSPPTKQPGKYNHLREIRGKVPASNAVFIATVVLPHDFLHACGALAIVRSRG